MQVSHGEWGSKLIYYTELAFAIMETEKFQDLQLASWRPRRASGVVPASVKSLRTRKADGVSSSLRAEEN